MTIETKDIIAGMMGVSRDTLEAQEYGTVEVDEYGSETDVTVTVSAYHWLVERAEYAPDIQAKFDAFVEDRENTHWMQDMEEFAEQMSEQELSGYDIINTYNYDSVLSDILQYVYFETPATDDDFGNAYIALQIHGGGDARGNYGAPQNLRGRVA